MAIEQIRGCGWRKVGGIYLVSGTLWHSCDRLPYPISHCPVCGEGLHFTRGLAKVNPIRLFGRHQKLLFMDCPENDEVCSPTKEVGYLLGVGEHYYTIKSFIEEAGVMGVSKRISAIPKDLKLGETWIYLTHTKAIENTGIGALFDHWQTGIFAAFIAEKVEQLIWESQVTPDLLNSLAKRGISPVIVPDSDTDHR